MVCEYCGAELRREAKFRSRCGKPQNLSPASRLAGIWMGYGYDCVLDEEPPERIRIQVDGGTITAIKITGDDCIRAGEVTWTGTFSKGKFPVRIQVSDVFTRRSRRFIDGVAHIVNDDHIKVTDNSRRTLTFRRVRE